VLLNGKEYSLTVQQSQIVQALWEMHQNGTPDLSQAYLLETVLGSTQKRLKDVFKGVKGWQALMVQGRTRGTVRLNI